MRTVTGYWGLVRIVKVIECFQLGVQATLNFKVIWLLQFSKSKQLHRIPNSKGYSRLVKGDRLLQVITNLINLALLLTLSNLYLDYP